MSCARNVRIVGAILLALVLPATVWGFYVLAVLFVIFGLPRLFVPERSVRLQQRSYPRRVHGVLLAHRMPGNARWNVAPWSGFAVAQSRPLWLSTIERLIDSPMPSPPGFVV